MTFGTISKGLPLSIVPGAVDFIAALVGDHFYNDNKFFSMGNIGGALKVSIPATIGYAWSYGRIIDDKAGHNLYASLGAAGVYAVIELVQHRKGDGNKGMEFIKDFAFAGVINVASGIVGTIGGALIIPNYFEKYIMPGNEHMPNYFGNQNTVPGMPGEGTVQPSFYPNPRSCENPKKHIGKKNSKTINSPNPSGRDGILDSCYL